MFIGQVNNVLCYFPRLVADVRYKLFKSYCSSIFWCEIWDLNNININIFCTAWRTGLRHIWKLPNTSHSDLLHMLSDDLPIYDEICRRSLLFIQKCIFHSSNIVCFVTWHGLTISRYKSLIGSNFYFCASRFGFNRQAFFDGSVTVNSIIRQCCLKLVDMKRICVACFLLESLIFRDIVGRHGYTTVLSSIEISCIVDYLATM